MAWIKRNIWIVVLSLISITVYPVAWKFSSDMNKNLKNDLQTKVKSAWSSVHVRIDYMGIQIDPNTPVIETAGVAPNAVLTAFYADLRQTQQTQLDEIVTMADEFNRRGRKPLIEGLFPEPVGENPSLVKIEMNKKFVHGPTRLPSVYEELFETINGGAPTDPLMLKDELIDLNQRNLAAKEATDGRVTFTPAEKIEMEKQLVNWRLATYRKRARDISVYVDMNSLPSTDSEGTWPKTFDAQLDQPPVTWQCYMWQHDYWTIKDVIEAIGRANTDENGDFMSIPQSPVKRIIKIGLTTSLVPKEGISSGKDPKPGSVLDAGALPLEPDFGYSVTGRFSAPDNRLYDVRNVSLEVVVAVDKLPVFFDALAQTNFITVTDFGLRTVNIGSDVSLGYFYGPDHVVRVSMNLEVLLLRSWTEPYMPYDIKKLLGIPIIDAVDDGFGDDGGLGGEGGVGGEGGG